ncbi:sigma factor regulator N-terminal domain-containing protein [Alteribacillus iranensis]|uniref:Sigma factor regulator C-terminal n=1 Tax=Alteribacillus iranensis TaxID=930128 RepID=A0A1I2D4B7_9BACI|nr:sigma factor regulator N-terminal domain-containing protein [Alteribacillus iranensis]SFE75362.1 Sigma factor regulator C-terminal [Alteribacillus iranensis]
MDSSLKEALRKAKRKQVIKTAIISVMVVLFLLPLLYQSGNYFASKSSSKLHEQLFLYHDIAQPNIQIDSQVTRDSSMFGGYIVTNRSKNINGYIVPWSTLTSSSDWFGYNIDYNELIPGFHWTDTDFYEYDKQTKNKVATFYHPAIEEYYNEVPNEISDIASMENHVAEVALSFDQPYTCEEIEANIPDNLNIVWLYMTSAIKDESKGPSGMPVYGFHPYGSPDEAFQSFLEALEAYDANNRNETIQDFLEEHANTPWEDVEILGVMVTGQTQHLEALEDQDFIRGASVGATVEMVPYITPEK